MEGLVEALEVLLLTVVVGACGDVLVAVLDHGQDLGADVGERDAVVLDHVLDGLRDCDITAASRVISN
jgi:hypothetical protein